MDINHILWISLTVNAVYPMDIVMVENRTYSAQYLLRLPESLRDRIKAYAARRGNSMNAEIVHVLEREWPEQWPLGGRLSRLAEDMAALAAGRSDPRIQEFIDAFEETVEGIVSGRVTDMDLETREAVTGLWEDYRTRRGEEDADLYASEYDEEEDASIRRIGRPEKYAIPRPERKQLGNLTDEEFDIYMLGYEARRDAEQKASAAEADDEPFPDPEDDDK